MMLTKSLQWTQKYNMEEGWRKDNPVILTWFMVDVLAIYVGPLSMAQNQSYCFGLR